MSHMQSDKSELELLNNLQAFNSITEEIVDHEEDLEELLDDDFNDTYEGNDEIKKLDSSLKIADDDSVDGDEDT